MRDDDTVRDDDGVAASKPEPMAVPARDAKLGDTVGARLREAIQRWGSIRRFQREMSARSVRGSSYSRIHGYLKDDLEPPPEFLDEAARLLGVRRAWLVDGQGEPTVAEEVLERTAREDRNEPVATEIEALIAREFMSYHRLPAAARALVWEAFQSHNGHALSVAIWSGEAKLSHRAIAQRMGRALAAPLDAMGLDPDRLPARQLGEFVEEMCQALKTLVPEPFTRGPMPALAVENDAAWLPSSERVTPHREVAGRPAP